MPKRELNRKQRKARWINVKNLMAKYPECAYDGDFYCNHLYEPAHPWVWIDFRFFHTKLKRYFSVAMTTLEYREYEKDSDTAHTMLEDSIGPLRVSELSILESTVKFKGHVEDMCSLREQSEEDKTFNNHYIKQQRELTTQLGNIPRLVASSIVVKDYGSVAVGVWASVDAPFIDEHYIRNFIKFFRDLGEPTKPGWTHKGEEIEVIPSRLNNRFQAS